MCKIFFWARCTCSAAILTLYVIDIKFRFISNENDNQQKLYNAEVSHQSTGDVTADKSFVIFYRQNIN